MWIQQSSPLPPLTSSDLAPAQEALWPQAGIAKHSPPGLSSTSERHSRAGSRYGILMVENLQEKQGEHFAQDPHICRGDQPIPSAGSSLQMAPSPAPQTPAQLRDPQHSRKSTSPSVPLSTQTSPGHFYLITYPAPTTQSYRPLRGDIPPPPRLQISAASAPPLPPQPAAARRGARWDL